jgi:manganese transport protein
MAVVPAVLVIIFAGEEKVYDLLILSQVVLSLQLSFAVVPLVKFTSSRQKMGPFVNRWWAQGLAWLVAFIIISLNGKLVYEEIAGWAEAAGEYGWLVVLGSVPPALGLVALLGWIIVRRERPLRETTEVSADEVAAAAAHRPKRFQRIGVALEALPSDSAMLAEAIALARSHQAELVLMHVVDGVGGHWYGPQTGDAESRHDEAYLEGLVQRLREELAGQGVPKVEAALGYGDPPQQIVRLTRQHGIDLVVLGGHGHKRIQDLLRGETISGVRHGLSIPVLTVR